MHGSAPWGGCAVDTAVLHLCAGQPVRLVREPANVFDPNAVLVETLWGDVLGYVPADMTHLFPHEAYRGIVEFVGQSRVGLWGARVRSSATASNLAFVMWV